MARRNLEDKTALITGASRGIGQAIAHRLIRGGVRVVAMTRNRMKAEPVEGVEWIQCDLSDEAQLRTVIDSGEAIFKEVDILINCAGYSDFGPVEKLPPQAIEKHLQVMLHAPIALTQAILPYMQKLNRGTIVNVSSLAVELPIPYLPIYNSAKAGLAGFSESLLLDLSETDIQVIDLRPGDFKTSFYASSAVADNLARREMAAWDAVRKKVEEGTQPKKAASDLWQWLRSGESGVLRTGSWFQSRLASWAGRFLPRSFMRRRILRYYDL